MITTLHKKRTQSTTSLGVNPVTFSDNVNSRINSSHVPSRRRVDDSVLLPLALTRARRVTPLDQYNVCQVAKMTMTSATISEARGRIVTWNMPQDDEGKEDRTDEHLCHK